jgi:hypothetical protein
MLLAGTTDYPNRLYFSAEGDYDMFTLGTDNEDASFDDVGLAGDKITALWANGTEWLIWKTNSMISYQGTNQYDLVASVISNKVGMNDPGAIVEYQGIVYFRSTEGKIWAYANGVLTEASRKIETFISSNVVDNIQARVYADKADFDTGTFERTASTITNGAVEPWLSSIDDTTDADFNLGTSTSILAIR